MLKGELGRKEVMSEVFHRTDSNILSNKRQSSKGSELSFSLLCAVFSPADEKLELTEQLEARSVFQEKPALKSALCAHWTREGSHVILQFDSNCALTGSWVRLVAENRDC